MHGLMARTSLNTKFKANERVGLSGGSQVTTLITAHPMEKRSRIRFAAQAILAIALFVLWTPSLARAQSAGQGSLQGTVTDSSGAVVPNATVNAVNTATGISNTRTSTSAGYYV